MEEHSSNQSEKRMGSEILGNLVRGNNDFVEENPPDYFRDFKETQTPKVTLLACADSRVHPNVFSRDPTNLIFTVRNIGNQLVTTLGSVDFGVRNLKTPLLIVLGHTRCGAVHTAMNGHAESLSIDIIRELDHLFIPLKSFHGHTQSPAADNGQGDSVWAMGVEQNVDHQVALCRKRYSKEVENGELVIAGAILDFINIYRSGEGRMVLININGETAPEKIKDHPILSELPPELKDANVRRIGSAVGQQ